MSTTLIRIPTLSIGGEGEAAIRSHQELRAALSALHESLQLSKKQDPAHDYDDVIVAVQGMVYGYDGGRLSFLAESILRQANILGLLARTLVERVKARPGVVVSIGAVASELNLMARELFVLLADFDGRV